MKEKLIGIIIIVLALTAILPNFIYATDSELEWDVNKETMDDMQYSTKAWEKLQDEGKADISTPGGTKTKNITETISLGSSLGSALAGLLLYPAFLVSTFMTIAARGQDLFYADKSVSLINWYTIEDTVFGEIGLFDADYFSINNVSNSSGIGASIFRVVTSTTSSNTANDQIKISVATWYYIIRAISVILALLMLIYTGIRMAISTVATEQAKYKQMLTDWVVSMALLFLMPYIIMAINLVAGSLTQVFAIVKANIIDTGFEQSIIWQTVNVLNTASGWSYVATAILYIIITVYEVKFFIMYLNRFLSMGFLIVISPIIAAIYPLNKTKIMAKSGPSQEFKTWFREYTVNAFLQPLHAGVYLVFVVSANQIFTRAPLLAMIFIISLSRSEKIIKNIFGMRNMTSIHSMAHYMPLGKDK